MTDSSVHLLLAIIVAIHGITLLIMSLRSTNRYRAKYEPAGKPPLHVFPGHTQPDDTITGQGGMPAVSIKDTERTKP